MNKGEGQHFRLNAAISNTRPLHEFIGKPVTLTESIAAGGHAYMCAHDRHVEWNVSTMVKHEGRAWQTARCEKAELAPVSMPRRDGRMLKLKEKERQSDSRQSDWSLFWDAFLARIRNSRNRSVRFPTYVRREESWHSCHGAGITTSVSVIFHEYFPRALLRIVYFRNPRNNNCNVLYTCETYVFDPWLSKYRSLSWRRFLICICETININLFFFKLYTLILCILE